MSTAPLGRCRFYGAGRNRPIEARCRNSSKRLLRYRKQRSIYIIPAGPHTMSLTHPALLAMADLEGPEGVVVRWADGEELRVQLDSTPDEAADRDDGCEAWLIIPVLEVLGRGHRGDVGDFIVISSNDPPVLVRSADGRRTWTVER